MCPCGFDFSSQEFIYGGLRMVAFTLWSRKNGEESQKCPAVAQSSPFTEWFETNGGSKRVRGVRTRSIKMKSVIFILFIKYKLHY